MLRRKAAGEVSEVERLRAIVESTCAERDERCEQARQAHARAERLRARRVEVVAAGEDATAVRRELAEASSRAGALIVEAEDIDAMIPELLRRLREAELAEARERAVAAEQPLAEAAARVVTAAQSFGVVLASAEVAGVALVEARREYEAVLEAAVAAHAEAGDEWKPEPFDEPRFPSAATLTELVFRGPRRPAMEAKEAAKREVEQRRWERLKQASDDEGLLRWAIRQWVSAGGELVLAQVPERLHDTLRQRVKETEAARDALAAAPRGLRTGAVALGASRSPVATAAQIVHRPAPLMQRLAPGELPVVDEERFA